MKKILIILGIIANSMLAFSQPNNPTPQALPFSQDFSSLTGAGGVYPAGFQGARIVEAEPNGTGRTGNTGVDAQFRGTGSNATTTTGIYDFTGKIGVVSGSFADFTIALALNTSSVTAPQRVRVTFDAMTMRNIYDGIGNNYLMGLTFQYRIGTSPETPFIIVPEATYESGTTPNETEGTTGQNIQSFSVTLPEECSGQPVVQVRWVMKRFSGNSGQRQSFAIDNITAQGITIVSKTYHIDADNGDDEKDGLTPLTAWRSLDKVNSTTFFPADEILFKAGGIWNGQLWPKGSGASKNPIVIDSYGTGPKPIINGNGIIQAGALKLYNQAFWEINNLEITNDASSDAERRGVEVIGNNFGLLEHIHLKNLVVHDIRGTIGNEMSDKRSAGIYFTVQNDNTIDTRFHNIRIEDCHIYNCQNQGIVTSHEITVADYPRTPDWERRKITDLVVRNNTIHHISKNAMIIRLADGGLVERNLCYETATGTTGNTIFSRSSINTVFQYNEGYLNRSPDYDGSLYDPDLNSPGTIWQYSYSHDNAHGLFWLCSGEEDTGIICRYNVSQNDKGNLVFMNFAVTDVKVYNNTFYIGEGLNPTILRENSGRDHTYTFHNNIVYNANPNPATARFGLATTGAGVQNRTITDNIFYRTAQPAQIDFATQNLTSDPLLVDPGSGGIGLNSVGGYKLQPGSPALNSGKIMDNNGGKDYFGISVSSTEQPNMGFYNGPGTTIAEVDPNFHIYLLTGQSNMVGSGPMETNIDSSSPRIKMMTENFEWVEASHPISYLPNAQVGPGLAFAIKMLENADPNVRIGIINTAVGGQPISAFAPGAPNSRTDFSIYDESVNRVNIAKTQGVLKGVLFHQGESNSGNNYSSWTNRVKELIENFRGDFNDPELPFIIGELGHFRETSPNINNQLPQLVSEVPYTALVSAEGLTDKGDGTHFDSPSASELGVRYALALMGIQPTTWNVLWNGDIVPSTGLTLTYGEEGVLTVSHNNTDVTALSMLQQPEIDPLINLSSTSSSPSTVKAIRTGTGTLTINLSETGDVEAVPMVLNLQVVAKELEVTANAVTKKFGDSDPLLAFTPIGLVNNDQLSDVFRGVLERTPGDDVGTYPITQGTMEVYNPNYILGAFTGADFEITKQQQQITLTAPEEVRLGTGTLTLAVSASSGLAPTLSLDGTSVATLSGTTLTLLGEGTVAVTANQDGNHNYESAVPITIVIRVVADAPGDFLVRVHPALSPNGDGINDFLKIDGIGAYSQNRLRIFDVSGKIHADIENYDNDRKVFTGEHLTDGTYFYRLDVTVDGKRRNYKGFIELKRN